MTVSQQSSTTVYVLVVDNDPDTRKGLCGVLRQHGFGSVACAGGREAKTVLRAADFDAVVTDILMPDGDGLSLITWIRNRGHIVHATCGSVAGEAALARCLYLRSGSCRTRPWHPPDLRTIECAPDIVLLRAARLRTTGVES